MGLSRVQSCFPSPEASAGTRRTSVRASWAQVPTLQPAVSPGVWPFQQFDLDHLAVDVKNANRLTVVDRDPGVAVECAVDVVLVAQPRPAMVEVERRALGRDRPVCDPRLKDV